MTPRKRPGDDQEDDKRASKRSSNDPERGRAPRVERPEAQPEPEPTRSTRRNRSRSPRASAASSSKPRDDSEASQFDMETEEEIQMFLTKWNLDDTVRETLRSADPNLQEIILTQFKPKQFGPKDERTMSNKFTAFFNSCLLYTSPSPRD